MATKLSKRVGLRLNNLICAGWLACAVQTGVLSAFGGSKTILFSLRTSVLMLAVKQMAGQPHRRY